MNSNMRWFCCHNPFDYCPFFRQTDSSGSGHSLIKALRVFRVLRPFKGVHKIKKLQVRAVKTMLRVTIVIKSQFLTLSIENLELLFCFYYFRLYFAVCGTQ